MKRYLIAIAAILVILGVAWAQEARTTRPEGRGGRGPGGFQNLSEEERAKMRERFQNMSEEEREKLRAQMRERGGFGRGGFTSPEEQQKAIKAIEAELAKLKKGAQIPRPEGGFQDLSEDERAKLREQMTKVRQEREAALQTIIAQVATLQGRRGPAPEGTQYLIISAAQLKPIQDSAVKEKATETAQLIERLMTRGSGRRGSGGRPPGAGQRPEGGQRGTRTPGSRTPGSRTPGGQGGR